MVGSGKTLLGGSCHKYHFCHDKHVVVTTKHVFCRDKSMLVVTQLFVATNKCLLRQLFVVTKVLSRQKYYVSTNIILSRQAYFCRDKTRVCRDKTFVATKLCFWQLPPMIKDRLKQKSELMLAHLSVKGAYGYILENKKKIFDTVPVTLLFIISRVRHAVSKKRTHRRHERPEIQCQFIYVLLDGDFLFRPFCLELPCHLILEILKLLIFSSPP